MSALARVAKVFSVSFAIPAESVTENSTPDDIPKWDSLGHMSMVAALEKEFGAHFELDEVMGMASVRAILEILAKKGIGA